ncbi:MAG: SDR family NAD(P)-dependent oxidoreductase [Woeseia sp.]
MTDFVKDSTAPVALITAGAAGIGRVMAEAFITQGYRVHVCDNDPAAIDSLTQANSDISATQGDVSNVAQVAQTSNVHAYLNKSKE